MNGERAAPRLSTTRSEPMPQDGDGPQYERNVPYMLMLHPQVYVEVAKAADQHGATVQGMINRIVADWLEREVGAELEVGDTDGG